MNSKEFELEIQKLDPLFSVHENPNRPGLSNIFYKGINFDLPVISTHMIKTEVDLAYRYEFPNGRFGRYWTQEEVTDRLKQFLKDYKDNKFKEYED